MEIVATVTVGNDTEGVKVDPELSNRLWGNASDAARAAGTRDSVKLQLLIDLTNKEPTWSLTQAWNYLSQHVVDTH